MKRTWEGKERKGKEREEKGSEGKRRRIQFFGSAELQTSLKKTKVILKLFVWRTLDYKTSEH